MDLRDLASSAAELVGSLTPSLIGSAVAQAWKPSLPFRQRLLQWIVGSTVSYYAMLGIVALTGWGGFAAQSIAFGIALIAVDATPRLAREITDKLTSVPGRIIDRFLPKKD